MFNSSTMTHFPTKAKRLVAAWLSLFSGMSRQGIVATSQWAKSSPRAAESRQLLWVLPASFSIGIGVSCLIAADVGVSPFDVWLSAVEQQTPLSIGQAGWATSALLYVVALMLSVRPTLRGASFVVLNGLMIDLALDWFATPDALVSRFVLAFLGWAALAAGIALVIAKVEAGGPVEAIMEAAQQRGRRPLMVRSAIEVTLFGAGVILGGGFGPMTVVIALGMSPAIALTLQALEDHRVGRAARVESASSSQT